MSSHSGEDDNLAELVEHFGSRLLHVFSYFFFSVEFKKDEKFLEESMKNPGPDVIQALRIGTIQTACLITTLLAIRDIHEFFQTGKKRHDDIKASDLGYKESLEFLTADELKRINKEIMHSTINAVKNYDASWDIQELASKCVFQSLHFLNWMKTNYPSNKHLKVFAAVIKHTTLIEIILTYAKKVNASKAS